MTSLDERVNTIAYRAHTVAAQLGEKPRFDRLSHVHAVYKGEALVIKDGQFAYDKTGRHPGLIITYQGDLVYQDTGYGRDLIHYAPGEKWEQHLEDAYYDAWLAKHWQQLGPLGQSLVEERISETEQKPIKDEKPIKEQ